MLCPVETVGTHLLVELHGCCAEQLNNRGELQELIVKAAQVAGATVLGQVFHPFSPHGMSGVVLISESHLSIHTWPEYGYVAVDFYTCGQTCDPLAAAGFLKEALGASRMDVLPVKRGQLGQTPSLTV